MSSTRAEVFAAISRERVYQDDKWGTLDTYDHTLSRWRAILTEELDESRKAYFDGNDEDSRRELLQAIAVGVACLEQHGVVEGHKPPADAPWIPPHRPVNVVALFRDDRPERSVVEDWAHTIHMDAWVDQEFVNVQSYDEAHQRCITTRVPLAEVIAPVPTEN